MGGRRDGVGEVMPNEGKESVMFSIDACRESEIRVWDLRVLPLLLTSSSNDTDVTRGDGLEFSLSKRPREEIDSSSTIVGSAYSRDRSSMSSRVMIEFFQAFPWPRPVRFGVDGVEDGLDDFLRPSCWPL